MEKSTQRDCRLIIYGQMTMRNGQWFGSGRWDAVYGGQRPVGVRFKTCMISTCVRINVRKKSDLPRVGKSQEVSGLRFGGAGVVIDYAKVSETRL
jgi:hypothetical protein